jgi:transcriptional regulator with XRE-family HTH domain
MKYIHSSKHRRACPHDPETRAQLGKRLRYARVRLGWSIEDAGKYFQVTERTWHNWETGAHRIPFAVYKLARVLARMEFPSEAWAGWRIEAGQLITPEGRQISPQDGSWWSLLVRQAAGFRTVYDQLSQLRRHLAVQRTCPASGAAADGQGRVTARLVPSKTSLQTVSLQDAECNQSDTIQTPCKPLLDYLTPSPLPPVPAPSPLESASTPSFASPWTLTCGVRWTLRPQPGPHLAGTIPHLKQVLSRSQPGSLESSPAPKSKPPMNGTKLPDAPSHDSSARLAGANATGPASASGGQS